MKINEVKNNAFYQLPQWLFDPEYKDMSLRAKVVYALIFDRRSLSLENNWYDKNGDVYMYFTNQQMMEKLNCSEKTIISSKKELEKYGLIKEVRQGVNRPNRLYINGTVKITGQELENLQPINTNNIKTNKINTESINPNSDNELHLKEIKDKCKLEEFTKEDKTILEDLIDSLYYKDTLKVGSVTVNHFKILDKLKLIVKESLIQLLDILKNIPNIQNAKNYLMICLYNNLGNTHITIPNKKENKASYKGREYENGSLDFLYANFAYDN